MNADPNTGINIMIGGKISIVGGTSAVAPAMAAYIARLGTNKFIIPRMYAASAAAATYAACFNDIKAGSNGAYSAKLVHDCCTGLGSLKGTPLKPLIA
jgi:kumamolisin